MKRLICIVLALCVLVGLSGCAIAPTADVRNKLGIGADASYTVSDTQKATVETTWAAVMLDANDRILACRIDAIKADVTPGVEGASFATKYDLKEAYGMVAYADADKEWYQQVDIFCEAVVGKTLEEAMNLQPGEADLAAGCTISVLPLQYALAKACQSAQPVDAAASDTLSVKLQGSASAAEGKDEFEFTFAAVTIADGKVTACRYDSLPFAIALENSGYKAEDSGAMFPSKREQGFDYGMVAHAGAQYEWFQQIDALEAAVIGKTAAEIAELLGDNGKIREDVDLASTATIYAGGIVGQIVAAVGQ